MPLFRASGLFILCLGTLTLHSCDQMGSQTGKNSTPMIAGEHLVSLNRSQRENVLHILTADPTLNSEKINSDCLGFILQDEGDITDSTATLVTALHCIAYKSETSDEIVYRDRLWLAHSGQADYVQVAPILSCGNNKHFAGDSTHSLSSLDLAFIKIPWQSVAGMQLAPRPSNQTQLEIYGQITGQSKSEIALGYMDWKPETRTQVYNRIIREYDTDTNYEPGDSGGPLTFADGQFAIGVAIARNGCGAQSNYMVDLHSPPSQALLEVFKATLERSTQALAHGLCPQTELQTYNKEITFCSDYEEIGSASIPSQTLLEPYPAHFYIGGSCHVSVTTWKDRYFLVASNHCASAGNALRAACKQEGIQCTSDSQVVVPAESDVAVLEIARTAKAIPASSIPSRASLIAMYNCDKNTSQCKFWPNNDAFVQASKAFSKKSIDRGSALPMFEHYFETVPSDSGSPIFEIDDDGLAKSLICLQSGGHGDNVCSNLSYWLDQI